VQPEIYGPYELLRRVQGDGISDTYAARCELSHGMVRECLLRRLSVPDWTDEAPATTVLDEVRVTIRLDHPGLIRVLDCGNVGQTLFIESEYIDGISLRRVLELTPRMTTSEALSVACSLAEGLDYLHRATGPDGQPMRIVHRNLMPENVLLTPSGEIKLGGFGLAGYVDRAMGATTMELRGRIGYISPEQLEGKPPHPRSDLFSLGILLYELLAGEPPFAGPNPGAVLDLITAGKHPPLADRAKLELPEVSGLVDHLLEASPLDRPIDAREVWRTLWGLRRQLGAGTDLRSLRDRTRQAKEAVEPPTGT